MRKRKVEVFSAGCSACQQVIELVEKLACPSCDAQVLDMKRPEVAAKAKKYGVKSVPAVAIDGRLAECCVSQGPTEANLRAAGVGVR